MGLLSFRELKSAVLFFIIFFGVSAVAQFLFVRAQTTGIIVQGLREDAADLNKAIAYEDGSTSRTTARQHSMLANTS